MNLFHVVDQCQGVGQGTSKNLIICKDDNKLKIADDSKKRGANAEKDNKMLFEGLRRCVRRQRWERWRGCR